MSAHIQTIPIPPSLAKLKPSHELESVSTSKLARTGTAVLQRILSMTQAIAVKVQGQGAMVTLSQGQYDEMVTLIRRLQAADGDRDFMQQALGERFDALTASMNRPGAAEATEAALFADPASLNRTYKPGTTETPTP